MSSSSAFQKYFPFFVELITQKGIYQAGQTISNINFFAELTPPPRDRDMDPNISHMPDSARHNLITPSNPADQLISQLQWQTIGDLFELSDRELKVAELLFSGESRGAIALALRKPDGSSLSPETVRVYIDRLYRKLNVTDQMQMAIRIMRVQRMVSIASVEQPAVTESVTSVRPSE